MGDPRQSDNQWRKSNLGYYSTNQDGESPRTGLLAFNTVRAKTGSTRVLTTKYDYRVVTSLVATNESVKKLRVKSDDLKIKTINSSAEEILSGSCSIVSK